MKPPFIYMKPASLRMTVKTKFMWVRGVLMRLSVAMAVACLMATGLAAADQANAAIRKSTNIEAQRLASALRLVAQEREVQIVYRSELVGDRHTSGAVGELTLEEALTQLLSDTGLTYQRLDD